MSAHNRLDAFLLERLHPAGATQAGIYATAYRLLDAGNVAGFLTASFLLPFLSRHRHDSKMMQQVILLSRHGLLLIAAGVVAFVLSFAPWLQAVLYHSTDRYDTLVMQLCLLALPAYYLVHVYGTALTATGHFRLFIGILVAAALGNLGLNLWLIPLYGALGCCVAALVSQYTCGILLWILASRQLLVALSVGSALLYVATAIVLGVLFYSGQMLTGNVWIILISIAVLLAAVVLWQRKSIRKVFLSLYK
jgi:O-antigen/teichoic acid export membrane protein